MMDKLGKFFIWVLAIIANGWVFTYLWKWFIVPLGVSPITLFHALGINLVVSYLTYNYTGEDYSDEQLEKNRLIMHCIKPIAVGLIGYLYYFLMSL